MTTTIKINVNGNYIAKGTLNVTTAEGVENVTEVSVGPSPAEGGPVEQSFYVEHGSTASLELVEKHSDEWAQAEVEGDKTIEGAEHDPE